MLPVPLLVAVGLLVTYVFMWLARNLQSNETQRSGAADVAKNVDKLRGFHGLAKVLRVT